MINNSFLNIVQDITTLRALSDDSSSEQKMSTVPSVASQEKQEKPLPGDNEQNNITGTKQSCSQENNLTDYLTEEKVEAKQEEISSKVEKSTGPQLREIKGMDKSDEKPVQTKTTRQSSLNFLKWTNKQPTHAKGKRRKE